MAFAAGSGFGTLNNVAVGKRFADGMAQPSALHWMPRGYSVHLTLSMKSSSFRHGVEEQRSRERRNGRFGIISMLPAGLILIVGSVVQLCRGDYTIGQNFYGGQTGPGIQIVMGLVLSCLGAIALWVEIQSRRRPAKPPDDKTTC